MDVYIDRRVAIEAVAMIEAASERQANNVALTRDRSVLDTGKVASSA
jgi:hypothetical protein